MVKITRPLFADAATGKIGDIGTFRKGQHGPEFMVISTPIDRKTPQQIGIRTCFKTAIKTWATLNRTTRPSWQAYWRTWLTQHPECQ